MAAVLVMHVLISSKEAYALEQTAEALKTVRFMHVVRRDRTGRIEDERWIEIGPDGTVYVLDNQNERVQKFSRDGEFILEWGNSGPRENYFTNLLDAIAVHEDRIYVSDILAARTLVFSDQGNFLHLKLKKKFMV